MDIKIRVARFPDYLKQFSCIGPSCQDNCCIGWDVDIDKKTYYRYQKVEDAGLKGLFKKCVQRNNEAYSDEVDFAKVKLLKNKKCPFLNEENLCKIQAKMGETYLSNVCATYPRFTNQVDDVYEHSATVSCPEAARLILMNRKGLEFYEEEEKPGARFMIMYQVDTRISGQNVMVTYLHEIRKFSISVLQNREYAMGERLLLLGYFFSDLQKLTNKNKEIDVPALIKDCTEKIKLKKFENSMEDLPVNIPEQMDILMELADKLNVYDEIDSERFINFTEEFRSGIFGAKSIVKKNPEKNYSDGYRLYFEPFMKKHGHILENYLVNYVFSNLFPAGESQKPFEAYSLLVARYALIKYYLIGIAASRRSLSEKLAVEFIQVFSKAVEHHKTFLESIPSHLKKKKCSTLSDMAILLKN